jgi:pyridoxamine 5'-phosphate oxidase
MNLADLRRDYTSASLDVGDVLPHPLDQLQQWLAEAMRAEVPEPSAMILATADAGGAPSARVVLLKHLDHDGLGFFTDYRSRKGEDLAANAHAAAVFFWPLLERQVRVRGTVAMMSASQSDAYFASRPRGSQLGAWASRQSGVLNSRAALDDALAAATSRFGTEPIPRPPHWGGYLLMPDECEFWQGRPSRLHDRISYVRDSDSWSLRRLSP